jgi:hypothetical protein
MYNGMEIAMTASSKRIITTSRKTRIIMVIRSVLFKLDRVTIIKCLFNTRVANISITLKNKPVIDIVSFSVVGSHFSRFEAEML